MFNKPRRANAKLTEEQVRVIKQDLKDYHEGRSGDSPRMIALALGLSTETVRRIDRGETWQGVGEREEFEEGVPIAKEMEAEALKDLDKILAAQKAHDEATRQATRKMEESAREVGKVDRELDGFTKG
ncbi:MAG: hypothetical protein ACRD2L_25380 [Terriglobia bacterium]